MTRVQPPLHQHPVQPLDRAQLYLQRHQLPHSDRNPASSCANVAASATKKIGPRTTSANSVICKGVR
jgi:hypothetical protein